MTNEPFSPDSFQTFGDLLRYLRRREQLTQLELSIRVGYSEAQMTRLEKNQRRPDPMAVKALFVPALHIEHEPEWVTRLLDLAQSARQEDAPVPGFAPYKGLLFFDEVDTDLFFGREALTSHLVDRVCGLALDSSYRFLAVVGASGSGKSSLVRAGLAAALKGDGWDVRIFTPGAEPSKALEMQLELNQDQPVSDQHLILVDQFEETFTLCHNEGERLLFIERLLHLAQDPLRKIIVVITLRADFYSHCAQYPLLRQAVAAEQEYMGQMSRDELRRAIEEPGKRGGWEFEPGLVDLLLNDIGADGTGQPEPGALPLLSHALLATWERRRGRLLTLDGYRASGGVRGAIAETAESVFTDQLNQTQQEIARDVFLRLTELGEGTEDTRRRAALNELVRQSAEATQLRTVLNTLAEARLVTLNEDSAEVAHEALIREWQRLHEWLTQDREGLLLHRHLTESAQEWEGRGHDPAELYRGARLAQVREWAAVNEERLNALEQAFLAASIDQEHHEALEREAQRQRELEAAQTLAETQRQAAKALRRRATYLAGALLVMVFLAAAAIFLRNQAETEKAMSASRELAAAAIGNLDDDPERSILLALQAESTAHTIESENALHRSLMASRTVLVIHHDGPISAVTFSPDGKRIATASEDKTAKIWDARTGQLLLTLTHAKAITDIAYSPDGKHIATSSGDQTVKIWDAASGEELLTLSGHADLVRRVAFSPDGTRLVTASFDGTAKVWNAISGEELLTFSAHGDFVWDAVFSPDGKRIASSGPDGNVRLWDANSGKELLILPVGNNAVNLLALTFSPECVSPPEASAERCGTRLAVTSENVFHRIMIWDADTGEVVLSGDMGYTGIAHDIAFSPNGNLGATGGANQKVNVWDSLTGQVLYTFSGHTATITGVTFSPDGSHIATASEDGTARIWEVSPPKEVRYFPFVASNGVDPNGLGWGWMLRYSPDGTRILTDYTDHDARIWDAVSGKELLKLKGFEGNYYPDHPVFSSNGKLVAAGGVDLIGDEKAISERAILVWDAETGKQIARLIGLEGIDEISCAISPDGTQVAGAIRGNGKIMIWEVKSGKASLTIAGPERGVFWISYSPDGKHLITGDNDGNGIIWDAATGQKGFTLSLHEQVSYVAYSPDGKHVALAGGAGTVSIWDASTGEKLLDFKGHKGWIGQLAFSPGGKTLATVSNTDDLVRMWDATSGVNLLTLPVDTNGVGGVAFTPDGKQLAVGADSGIYIFIVPIQDLITFAESRLTRQLTSEECQKYLHREQCPARQRMNP